MGIACLFFAALAAFSQACGDPQPTTPDAGVAEDASTDAGGCGSLGCVHDLEDASLGVRANAVLGGCAGGPESSCHGSGAGGMHLPDNPPNLVNVASAEVPGLMRVVPGDPEHSYLYLKVTGDPRIDGGRMPPISDPLTPPDVELLRSWIEAGAPRK